MSSEPTKKQEDHWSALAYQTSASFVPKLATKFGGHDCGCEEGARDAGFEGEAVCKFEVLDASQLSVLPASTYTKIFSNAAMHWIFAVGIAPGIVFYRGQ
ncbi:hypothetical protein DID88_000236 [Monilinia fructigena]|uniref:Uncharacterized protein n=1 Tax=Monilinia fructigena TaxID=38457 RepID=A0A395IJW9_9HELO|nr:hypothetical protein DID88_000236 [Monilinia fructigena]